MSDARGKGAVILQGGQIAGEGTFQTLCFLDSGGDDFSIKGKNHYDVIDFVFVAKRCGRVAWQRTQNQ